MAQHQRAFSPIASQFRRRFERNARLLEPAELAQQIAADGRQQMIGFQRGLVREAFDDREPGLRSLGHADHHRAIELDDRGANAANCA